MSGWLLQEEETFKPSLLIRSAARASRADAVHAILLRAVRILDNRRLFFSSDIIVYCVVVDGYPDMKSGMPFWTQQYDFFKVKDGATLPIDPEGGLLLYHGRPREFLNLYLLAIRNTEASREFAKLLKENFVAQGLGTLAGAAVSIYANLPPEVTVPAARDLTTTAVDTTIDYFARRGNLVIGVYYASLIGGSGNYGLGYHPSDFPESLLNCGGGLELAYEVLKQGES